jgi:hypothetical protein
MCCASDKPTDQQLVVWRRFDAGWAGRVRTLIDDELIAEHRRAPRGPHSDRLSRVLHYFRSRPIPGKLIVIEEIPWRRYRIGVLTGVPGRAARPLDDSYAKLRPGAARDLPASSRGAEGRFRCVRLTSTATPIA